MLIVKEKIWNHKEAEMKEEIQPLRQQNIHLQVCCRSSSPGFKLWFFWRLLTFLKVNWKHGGFLFEELMMTKQRRKSFRSWCLFKSKQMPPLFLTHPSALTLTPPPSLPIIWLQPNISSPHIHFLTRVPPSLQLPFLTLVVVKKFIYLVLLLVCSVFLQYACKQEVDAQWKCMEINLLIYILLWFLNPQTGSVVVQFDDIQ